MGKFRAKPALGQIVFSAFAPRNTQIYFGDISGELEIHFIVFHGEIDNLFIEICICF